MKMLNGEIFGAVQALNTINEEKWPVKGSLGLIELGQILNPVIERIEKVRNELVKKHASGGESITPESENWGAFTVEYNELMMAECEVEFKIVTLPLVVNGKDVAVTPITLKTLEKFVVFKEA